MIMMQFGNSGRFLRLDPQRGGSFIARSVRMRTRWFSLWSGALFRSFVVIIVTLVTRVVIVINSNNHTSNNSNNGSNRNSIQF